jgi:hypothetical protein
MAQISTESNSCHYGLPEPLKRTTHPAKTKQHIDIATRYPAVVRRKQLVRRYRKAG